MKTNYLKKTIIKSHKTTIIYNPLYYKDLGKSKILKTTALIFAVVFLFIVQSGARYADWTADTNWTLTANGKHKSAVKTDRHLF